ncbi:MAG: serine/threonine-protein kinase, partial [Bryobacteraceae bacterium]
MSDDSSAARWARLDELFYAASEMDAPERAAFIANSCGDDGVLRAELEALLRASEYTHGFLQKPLNEAARSVVEGTDQTGQLIGRYRVIRELGEGGMGRVYLAVRADEQYQQRVAIKIMHGGLVPSNTMLLRFRTERQILANLQHPNIARLLDGGVTEAGLPYLVMEYVDGIPINKYCEGRSIEERLRLFRTVCNAVEYAHANLVVHRDIKPLNILVTADGTPKLLDFGIAKLLDPNFTGAPAGQRTYATDRLMTPEYASPEQILGEPVTTATDVYALGTLLYELLAGAQPFGAQKLSPLAFARYITEVDPEPPSAAAARNVQIPVTDARRMRGDLDNVVRTAMRKEPARRYASVAQFAADIEAYVEGYPLLASADSWRYRASKFLGRHKRGVAVTAGVVALLIGSTIEMAVLAQRARREQAIAQQETQFLASVFSASTPEESQGTTITARDLLDRGAKRIDRELAGQPEVQASMLESIATAYRSIGQY